MAQLVSFMPTPRGKSRKGGSALREMCGSSVHRSIPHWMRKARSLSTRLGPARPLGTRRGDIPRVGPLFRQTDFCDTQDPRPRFGGHVLGLRLSATPSDHAFRPRLSHAFQPRISATPSGHVFRRAIRIEDVEFLSQLVDTVILDSDRREWEKVVGYTQPHCADANHLTLLVQGLDAVKHHARSNSKAKLYLYPCMLSIQAEVPSHLRQTERL